jgi:hypothetical protein
MPTINEISCAAVLYAAVSAPLGIVVRTNNPTKARAALYDFRAALGDTELASLSIRVSPDNTEGALWILNGKQNALTVNIGEI